MRQLKMIRRADKPAPYKLHEDFEFVQCTEDTIQLWIDAAIGLTGEPFLPPLACAEKCRCASISLWR